MAELLPKVSVCEFAPKVIVELSFSFNVDDPVPVIVLPDAMAVVLKVPLLSTNWVHGVTFIAGLSLNSPALIVVTPE